MKRKVGASVTDAKGFLTRLGMTQSLRDKTSSRSILAFIVPSHKDRSWPFTDGDLGRTEHLLRPHSFSYEIGSSRPGNGVLVSDSSFLTGLIFSLSREKNNAGPFKQQYFQTSQSLDTAAYIYKRNMTSFLVRQKAECGLQRETIEYVG